jgi:hypothetical protein
MELLDRNVPPGTAVNLVDGDRSDAALVASDAAGCALVLMTADGACKKLHREETIQVSIRGHPSQPGFIGGIWLRCNQCVGGCGG